MTERELINLLKRHKDSPVLGGGFGVERAQKATARLRADIGFTEEDAARRYGVRAYAEYAGFVLRRSFAQPFSVATSVFSAFAIVFGGWVATVNASFDSLPGDVLYPVKLATERMQLTLASSSTRRAKLHAEFASRRLQEAGELSVSSRADRTEGLKTAVAGFTQEIVSAKEQLAAVGQESPSEAVGLAVVLDQKADEYHALLAQAPSSEPSVKQEVADAQAAVNQVNNAAVDTLVTAHENGGAGRELLEQNFQKTVMDLRTRTAQVVARLSAIKQVLSAADHLDVERESRIAAARQEATSQDKVITEAMNAFAAGGARHAFTLVEEADRSVSKAEVAAVELELSITTPPAPAEEPEVPPAF